MKVKKIKTEKYLEFINPKNTEFENLYKGLKSLSDTVIKYKSITVMQIEKNDDILKYMRAALLDNSFPIVLSNEFTDSKLFDGFPESLHKKEYYAQFLEVIVSNTIYYTALHNMNKFDDFMDEITAMAIIFQTKLIIKVASKLYDTENQSELYDNFAIIIAYAIFRYQLNEIDSVAKVKATDLLLKANILKSKKFDSRIEINMNMKKLINTDKNKNLYDCLYNAGYFLEFINPKRFLKNLAQYYHPMLIKGLFFTPKFNNNIDYKAFLGYKILVISVTDILHEINQFNKFRVSLYAEFRIMKRISFKLIAESSKNMKP